MSQSPEPSGAIYDLGYQRYDGPRLGRQNAFEALFWQGVRAAFGLGRRPASKIAPFVLAGLALIPALIYLGVAAIGPGDLDLIATEDYLGVIFVILVLFVAVVAPDIVGRDQRYRTLSLYFTRPIERDDYALTRLAALSAATLAVTLAPQTVLYIGNALASASAWDYLRDEWQEIPSIIASGTVVAVYASAVGLAVACFTGRRAFAMGGIVAVFFLSATLGNILAETVAGGWLLLDPTEQVRATTLLLFASDPDRTEPLGTYGIEPWQGALVLVIVAAAAIAVLIRRYRTIRA
jgi:ABC-2 type transport system permease protein